MENQMTERPKCFGCGNPGYLVIGRRVYCGECSIKIQDKMQEQEEEKIKELLK